MLLLFSAAHALVASPPIRVFDGTFAPDALAILRQAGEQRSHSFTSVFDRGLAVPGKPQHGGRTIIETALTSVLDELRDTSRYVEYWWRGESKGMDAHRDVDEALCRSSRVGDAGVQRCPVNGHVLYLEVGPSVRGPTCVWEEVPATAETAAAARARGGDERAGRPRDLCALHVVPARDGRLLRFEGHMLHSVAGPLAGWLPSGWREAGWEAATGVVAPVPSRRAVLLFNTWDVPPELPSPNEPAAAKAVASFESMGGGSPRCHAKCDWAIAPSTGPSSPASAEHVTRVDVPLLGDAVRRGQSAPALAVRVGERALGAALASEVLVHSVSVEPATQAEAGDGATAAAGAVVEDGDELLAMREGHADFLERDFFGGGEDDEGWDEEGFDDDDDGGGGSGPAFSASFMEQLAKLQTQQPEQGEGED